MVDPESKKIVGEVATGTGPHEVTASADGKLAFVANYGDQTPGDSLSVIDVVHYDPARTNSIGIASLVGLMSLVDVLVTKDARCN
jgi:DNA-binding beta-propeller fold protein YncE